MKIVILQGSPNKKGSTNILVENFSKGAEAAGHSVIRFDLDEMNIRPCTGCVTCGYEGPCILHDDNQKIREAVLDADMIVFATPLYYYGMSAQLKIVTRSEEHTSELQSRFDLVFRLLLEKKK